jgi:hypothetical protein
MSDDKLNIIIDELKKQGDKITELEKGKITTDILVKNFTEISKELSKALINIEKTMIGIQVNLTDNTKDIACINYKMTKLNDDFTAEVDKNKIDIRDINKDSIVDYLKKFGVGVISVPAIYGIYEAIMKIVETQ